jgi:XTP/dITP diphosphohydrolase
MQQPGVKPLELLIGTRNKGKIKEIETSLCDLPIVLRMLREFSIASEPEERENSYEENAVIKARHYSNETGLLTLADDSGLEVEALGGGPGVVSARYGGDGLNDAQRLELLLENIRGVSNRRARFVCVVAIEGIDSSAVITEDCTGTLAESAAGHNGFGYDPIFVPDGYDQTFAQLPVEVKDRISHRGKALARAREYLRRLVE